MEQSVPIRAKLFIVDYYSGWSRGDWMTACLHWHSDRSAEVWCYLLIAVCPPRMKVKLPGMESTMSVTFLFVLLGVLELSLAETLVIGCMLGVGAELSGKQALRPERCKVVFNVVGHTQTPSACLTSPITHRRGFSRTASPLLLLVTSVLTFLQYRALAIVIALVEKRSLRDLGGNLLLGPTLQSGRRRFGGARISFCNRYIGWQNALLILPIMYGIYRSYHLYLGRLEDQKKRVEIEELQVLAEKLHVEEVCALHLRTIEGLALAIDAKDHTTHQHLHRVRTVCPRNCKELGLSELKTRMPFEPRLFCTTSASWLCPITSSTSPAG
jgi:hypothetical protein